MERHEIEELFYGKSEQQRRFTQDFPILPDVWIAYGADPKARLELLLTPNSNKADAAALGRALRARLSAEQEVLHPGGETLWTREHPNHSNDPKERPIVLFNESVVLARLSFWELIRVALPLTAWWERNVLPHYEQRNGGLRELLGFVQEHTSGQEKPSGLDPRLLRKLVRIVSAIEMERKGRDQPGDLPRIEEYAPVADLFQSVTSNPQHRGLIWGVSRNRPADTSVWRSRVAIKADAAALLFDVNTSDIRWAVLDTGIDATHEAFARRDGDEKLGDEDRRLGQKRFDEYGNRQFASRVVRTYDFLRLKDLLDPSTPTPITYSVAARMRPELQTQALTDLKNNLEHGKATDWALLEPFLRVPHDPDKQHYVVPKDSHGTHVAGILAANWPEAKETSLQQKLRGICTDLELFDIRVLGPGADEFSIITALQFVRYLNAHKDKNLMLIHGVNLSMSVQHDVANYACGRTPVCEECERVVSSGVVVVTAAGNRGFDKLARPDRGSQGDYRYISITDPGNAQGVITVGSTHRFMPHTYGVSYFSSRGPTGDGRTKPDLVAPGERIDSCSLDGDFETMDGTSMAAPHVSGAAALLLARHRELIGQPERVKEVLVRSATDLGREPRFQGGGMLDVLRALQSI